MPFNCHICQLPFEEEVPSTSAAAAAFSQGVSPSSSVSVAAKCGHLFHSVCLNHYWENFSKNAWIPKPCPVCEVVLLAKDIIQVHACSLDARNFGGPTPQQVLESLFRQNQALIMDQQAAQEYRHQLQAYLEKLRRANTILELEQQRLKSIIEVLKEIIIKLTERMAQKWPPSPSSSPDEADRQFQPSGPRSRSSSQMSMSSSPSDMREIVTAFASLSVSTVKTTTTDDGLTPPPRQRNIGIAYRTPPSPGRSLPSGCREAAAAAPLQRDLSSLGACSGLALAPQPGRTERAVAGGSGTFFGGMMSDDKKSAGAAIAVATTFAGGKQILYGFFKCPKCRVKWGSSHTFIDEPQTCRYCGTECFPFGQHPVRSRHLRDLLKKMKEEEEKQ